MIIGIDGSRAFLKQRTGIEEYSYQVIKHLTKELRDCQVVLYLRDNQEIDFDIPKNWKIKKLWLPYFTSQIRFSLEFLFNPIDVLFIPAHVVPPIHPKKTIVTIHGLEYEFVTGAYSWWARLYMRTVIKNSCHWAKKIIAVSKNTRQDLVNLYKVPEEKIEVIYEGYEKNLSFRAERSKVEESNSENSSRSLDYARDDNAKYLLFIGRLEKRKNIIGIIRAFQILKEKYKIPHKLVLAGKFGYGEWEIHQKLKNINCSQDIILPGYVSEDKKWELLKNADVFLFPTFYEGFGLPILEAQSVGVPVVASNASSIPEIANGSALLADPTAPEFIAKQAYELISNEELRNDIIKKGYENVKRFSWAKCAAEISKLLTK
ncbi:MAG TPA: glycosyltransferase family 1 protein [Patescibacteria group bacterium]